MSAFLHDFAERFAALNKDNLDLLGKLYSDDVLFRDPLHEVHGLTAVRRYFAELYANVEALHFEFHGFDQVAEGEGYLRWTMRYRHPRLRGSARSPSKAARTCSGASASINTVIISMPAHCSTNICRCSVA